MFAATRRELGDVTEVHARRRQASGAVRCPVCEYWDAVSLPRQRGHREGTPGGSCMEAASGEWGYSGEGGWNALELGRGADPTPVQIHQRIIEFNT